MKTKLEQIDNKLRFLKNLREQNLEKLIKLAKHYNEPEEQKFWEKRLKEVKKNG